MEGEESKVKKYIVGGAIIATLIGGTYLQKNYNFFGQIKDKIAGIVVTEPMESKTQIMDYCTKHPEEIRKDGKCDLGKIVVDIESLMTPIDRNKHALSTMLTNTGSEFDKVAQALVYHSSEAQKYSIAKPAYEGISGTEKLEIAASKLKDDVKSLFGMNK